MPLNDSIKFQTRSGTEREIGDFKITPQAQSLIIEWPNGGFVWNRPTAIVVSRADYEERIAITDATRVAQIVMYASAILFSVLTILLSTRRR